MALGTAETAAVAIVLLGNISAWSKMIYDARKNGKNGNGNGKSCPSHVAIETRIAAIETHKDSMEKELSNLHTENRQDHQRIFDDIKSLSVSVASAAASAASAAAAISAKRGRS